MNNIMIVFGQTSVVNTYEFSLGNQIAARYPMNALISTFQKDALKSKDSDFMRKVEEHVQRHGSETADPLIAMLGGSEQILTHVHVKWYMYMSSGIYIYVHLLYSP